MEERLKLLKKTIPLRPLGSVFTHPCRVGEFGRFGRFLGLERLPFWRVGKVSPCEFPPFFFGKRFGKSLEKGLVSLGFSWVSWVVLGFPFFKSKFG